MNTPMKMLIGLLLMTLIKVLDYIGAMPDVSVQPGDYWKQPGSVLVQVDTQLQTRDNFLYNDQLIIKLPYGVTASIQELGTGQAGDVIDLENGGDGLLAPRMWITHYRYRMKDMNEWAMTSALLGLLPDTTLRLCHREKDADEFLFTYIRQETNGYILIQGNDVYIVEELCDENAFGKRMDAQAVYWADGSFIHVDDDSDATWFDRLVVGEDTFLVFRYTARDGKRWMTLMRDGDYGQIYQQMEPGGSVSDEWLICKDYNFDGYTDINFSSEILYVWDSAQKQYVRACVTEEFMQLQETEFFPDTATIWGYQCEQENAENQDQTETLWQWEKSGGDRDTIVKKRECRAQIRGEAVRLNASDSIGYPDAEFDQLVTLGEYRQGSARVRELYKRFYDKMAPAELYARIHAREYGREQIQYIPQELLDKTVEAMLGEARQWELIPGDWGEGLEQWKVLSIAKENKELRGTVAAAGADGSCLAEMADADNDGIMDLIVQKALKAYDESDALKEYAFYQGQEDGTYRKTDAFSSVHWEYDIINYEGKNYLRQARYNEEQDRYEDIRITCFVDGKGVERAECTLVPESYDIVPAQYTQTEYRQYANQLAAVSTVYKAMYDRYGEMEGSCEEELPKEAQYQYQCDLNNDGEIEQYSKILRHVSRINASEYMHFNGKGVGVEAVNDALYSLERTPVMIWVETFQGKNIVNMMVLTGLEDFEITSFLVTGSEYEKICGVRAEAYYGVSVTGRRL